MAARKLFGALALLLACACSDDEKPAPNPTPNSDGGTPPMGWRAAVGDDGTIVETFADATWTARRLGDQDLFAVSCVNNRVGWAVGSRGAIFHTADGGESWWPQSSTFSDDLLATAFAVDASGAYVGVIAGRGGALAVTRDGSVSWRAIETEQSGALRGAASSDGATLLLASGDGGLVFRSEDLGESWSRITIAEAGALTDIAADANGALVLATDDRGSIWVSRDRALTFSREASAEAPLATVSVGYDGAWAIAAGAGGTALVRDPNGTWQRVNSTTTEHLHAALVAPNGLHFYVAGDAGTLLETQDQGRSFLRTQFSSAVPGALRGIEDLSPR
jgi:photosystem II stability/assembly factor-like uncharacterized protein